MSSRGHALSPMQFGKQIERGQRLLNQGSEQSTSGLQGHAVSSYVHQSTREPWGGATLHPETGQPVHPKEGFAVSVKDPGQQSVSVPINETQFGMHKAIKQARQSFGSQLSRTGNYLGTFHDADKGTVDIDPVRLVGTKQDARSIGAATDAKGGAYNFATGGGAYPPHPKGMSNG